MPATVLRTLARWRWRSRFFSLPLDYTVPAFLMRVLGRIGFGGVVDRLRPERV
jgi:hypothetical protein